MITTACFENQFCCRVLTFRLHTEKVKLSAGWNRITIVLLGENKGKEKRFGCFNSQILVVRADVSDFHVSRTADS